MINLKKVKDKCFDICKEKGHNNDTCYRKKKKNKQLRYSKTTTRKLRLYKKGYISKKESVYNCNTMINKVLKDNYDPS